MQIPVIDLSLGTFESQATAIGAALSATGFFSLVGHGIAPAVFDDAFDASQRFFRCSDADKALLHINQSRHKHGFDPVGWQALDAAAPPDLKESFYIGAERALDHPLVLEGIENQGPNQWPSEAKLPGFKAACNTYSAHMDALARRLMSLIAVSLQLRPDHFEPFMRDPSCTTRLLHYPPQPASAQLGQLGCGEHTDWGAITLLAQDNAGGLQARLPKGSPQDGSWQDISPILHGLVVNSGDMLQRWTNDRYLSNLHRVVNKVGGRERFSIAYFFDLDHHALVEALPSCVSADRPAKYPPIKAGEHLIEMYRKTTVVP